MNAESIRPPTVIPVGNAHIVRAGSPRTTVLSANKGEAGGYTVMQNYTTEHGLALDAGAFGDKSAICDRFGNLWFCTDGGGVSRYDGKSFVNYTNAQGLPNNNVRCITEDRNGNLWFGTYGGGLSFYDGRTFTNFGTEQGLPDNHVLCSAMDKAGRVWFGLESGGACYYNGRSFVKLSQAEGLIHNTVLSILADRNGKLWFGTFGGLSCYDGHSFANFTTANGLPNDIILCINEDRAGKLWFGTERAGLSCYDGKTFHNFDVEQGLANHSVMCITEDRSGNLWIGTYEGISRYDGSSFTNFTKDQGLTNNTVVSITQDKTGALWFFTYGGGLNRYDGKAFTNYTTAQGLSDHVVHSIAEDGTGKLWFGTYGGGVISYNGSSFVNYSKTQGLPSNTIYSIVEYNGKLWFGTADQGLSCYDGKSFANFGMEQGLMSNNIRSLMKDKAGHLWIGTSEGVSCYDGKSLRNFTRAQGLAGDVVLSMVEDHHGKLWFGTLSDGVSCYDGKTFTNFTTKQGLPSNEIRCMVEDRAGILWVATYGGGVCRYDGSSFIHYTTEQGLPDNNVTQLLLTQDQNIVVGTNLGTAIITAFIRRTSSRASDTLPVTNTLSNRILSTCEPVVEIYNSVTGYPVKDVNAGSRCLFQDSKGIIWMATGSDKTGLVRFDYLALNKSLDPPRVVIQSVNLNEEAISWHSLHGPLGDSTRQAKQEALVYGKPLSGRERKTLRTNYADVLFDSIERFYPLPEHLVIPHKNNHIGFEFVALEPARPYLVKYQYHLEGYDKSWSPITDKTSVSFGNMHEGTYTFKLKARGPQGVWSEPVSYTFTVLPPWWRTWWMYSVYAILLIVVIITVNWLNSKILRARARELKIKVQKATQTITVQKQIVEQQKREVEEKHKEITDSITYAERIQRSLLASKDLLNAYLNDYFVLFKPKSIVSGDFYWVPSKGQVTKDKFLICVADSTGHGVPGAIMSILNIACLEKTVEFENVVAPNQILDGTRKKIVETLRKDGSGDGGWDGMDGSLLSFDFQNLTLECALANSPVWIVRGGELIEIKGDRYPIGKHAVGDKPFTLHQMQLQKGDAVYALSDGFADQFGGPYGKKFKYKHLQDLLVSISREPMLIQKEKLNTAFENWRGHLEQVDDVTVFGVRI